MTSKSADKGSDVGEANAFARLILDTGAAEQVEDAFVILLADAAAVILNLD